MKRSYPHVRFRPGEKKEGKTHLCIIGEKNYLLSLITMKKEKKRGQEKKVPYRRKKKKKERDSRCCRLRQKKTKERPRPLLRGKKKGEVLRNLQ